MSFGLMVLLYGLGSVVSWLWEELTDGAREFYRSAMRQPPRRRRRRR